MPKKILIVDSDENALSLLKKKLSDYTIITSTSFEGALTIIKKDKIDLAILDTTLKDHKSGFDLFKNIIDLNNKIKIIFLSNRSIDSNKKLELKNLGAYDFLTKPFEDENLFKTINRAANEVVIKGKIILGYGELAIEKSPSIIETVLGSCVAVILYDPILKIGGMTHILYPNVKNDFDTKGAFQAVSTLITKILALGSDRNKLRCELYGGANIHNSFIGVGDKNLQKAKTLLTNVGIKINNEDTGGNHPRKITFNLNNGNVTVQVLQNSFNI